MDNLKLFNELQKVWLKMDSAKSYVDDGKEVLCSQKLQGAMTNLSIIIEMMGESITLERNKGLSRETQE